jgi:amino acid transporter
MMWNTKAQAFLPSGVRSSSTGRQLTAAAALLTTAATANAVLVVTSRVAFAMARDGLLPALVARVHPKTGTPWGAVLLNGILLALVALTGSVMLAAAVGGFLYVLHFLFTLIALVILLHLMYSKVNPSAPFVVPASSPHASRLAPLWSYCKSTGDFLVPS